MVVCDAVIVEIALGDLGSKDLNDGLAGIDSGRNAG
jgi:hypothetical protein